MRDSQNLRRGRYHHGNLSTALAEAAARLAREGGPEAVVLREAARRVGVSATAAYRHFTNHDDLLHVVKQQALEVLADQMEAEIAAGAELADPVAEALRRFRVAGRGYMRFALGEPGLFRTACCHIERPPDAPDPDPFASRPLRILSEILDTLARHGKIGPRHRAYAELAAWASVHGLALLLTDGPLARLPEPARDAAIDRTLDMVIDGICQAD